MQPDYVPFVDRMIDKYEGGYCWDKGDPGGPTKYGITCYDLAEHRGQKMTSMASWQDPVKGMTRPEAEEIYATKYAAKLCFNQLNTGVDCVMMDYGVNSGYARAARVACAIVAEGFEKHPSDTVTPGLLEAINKKDPKWFIETMCAERLSYMHRIRNGTAWQQFGGGWGKRVADLQAYSEHLLVGGVAPTPPDLSKVSTPKATNVAPTSTTTGASTGTVVAGGGAAHAAGVPAWAIAAGVATVVVGAVGLIVYHQYKADKANRTVILPKVA